MRRYELAGRRTLRLARDVPTPRPGSGEVLVEVGAATICNRSDLVYYHYLGERDHCAAGVFGHEVSGTVIAVGDHVTRTVPGRRVFLRTPLTGGFADFALAREVAVGALPDSVSFEAGAVLQLLPLAVHATRGIRLGDRVAILGQGPVGLMTLQVTALRGASEIVVADLDPWRLERSADLGAGRAVVVDLAADAAYGELGAGFDVAIDAVGTPQTANACVDMVRHNGLVVFLGTHHVDSHVTFDLVAWEKKCLRVHTAAEPTDADRAAAMVVAERLIPRVDSASLVSEVYRLEELPKAIERLSASSVLTPADRPSPFPGPAAHAQARHRPVSRQFPFRSPAQLRWGVAGYGDVVRRRALAAFAQAGQDVVCLWGRDGERAAAAALAHGLPRGTADLASMLAEVDAVYVATPVATHVPLVKAALRAGRHVLAEKPLGGALDYDRAELLALAQAVGATTGVAYYRRFAPLVGYLRGAVGGRGPFQVAIRFAAPFDPAESDPMHWRTVQALSGGGVLADAGSHRLDLLCLLFGRPEVLRAELAGLFPGGAERRAKVDLGWRDGTTARLDLAWREGPAADQMTIDGSGRRWDIPVLDEGAVIQAEDGHSASLSLPPIGNPLVPAVADFAGAVAGRRDPGCPLAEAMLVDDLLRAARDGGRRFSP